MSEAIGERIVQARIGRKLSQVELARRLDMNQSSLSKYERGTKTPRATTLERIAVELRVPYFWLATGLPDEEGERD